MNISFKNFKQQFFSWRILRYFLSLNIKTKPIIDYCLKVIRRRRLDVIEYYYEVFWTKLGDIIIGMGWTNADMPLEYFRAFPRIHPTLKLIVPFYSLLFITWRQMFIWPLYLLIGTPTLGLDWTYIIIHVSYENIEFWICPENVFII